MGLLDKIIKGVTGGGLSGGLGNLLGGNLANLMGGSGNLLQKFQMLNNDRMSNDDIQVDLESLKQNPESNTLDIQNIIGKLGGSKVSLSSLKNLVMDKSTNVGDSLKDIFSKLGK